MPARSGMWLCQRAVVLYCLTAFIIISLRKYINTHYKHDCANIFMQVIYLHNYTGVL